MASELGEGEDSYILASILHSLWNGSEMRPVVGVIIHAKCPCRPMPFLGNCQHRYQNSCMQIGDETFMQPAPEHEGCASMQDLTDANLVACLPSCLQSFAVDLDLLVVRAGQLQDGMKISSMQVVQFGESALKGCVRPLLLPGRGDWM